MSEAQNHFQQLQQKLADIQKRQELFHLEILQIEKELVELKKAEAGRESRTDLFTDEPLKTVVSEQKSTTEKVDLSPERIEIIESVRIEKPEPVESDKYFQSNLERFIGENLINKIGIIVTVIGVAIGTKYAIDNDLISPLTRIILGYLVGAGLLVFAVRLKNKYENFSAVLLSGSMAIMYFITYAAFSFYSIYPQFVAFILMVIITAFTVTAALKYNREIISIFGLVGAYAIPFLLSDETEDASILFSYISIINIGILIISFKKYWKPLYFSAFILTWLIYFTWFFAGYQTDKNFTLASLFLFLFFAVFYLTFLSYKLIRKEKFDIFDIVLLLLNSFIFYGVGYSILNDQQNGDKWLGLFTFGNSLIHLIVSVIIYRNRLADRNLFYLVSGLFLVFVTIAIPVQLNGNWVTLLWICQAALLFYIGRTKNAAVYEYISYELLLLAFLSLAQDWGNMQIEASGTNPVIEIVPIFNIHFLSSLLFIAAFASVLYFYFSRKYISPLISETSLKEMIDFTLPALFIIVVYFTFSNEISAYWNHKIALSNIDINGNIIAGSIRSDNDLNYFKMIWRVNYSLLFFAVFNIINIRYLTNKLFSIIVFWVSFVTIFFFLIQSLYLLSELRESFLSQSPAESIDWISSVILIRYISFIFVALSLTSLYLLIRKNRLTDYYKIIFNLMFHLTVLWILSSEMLNIMDLLKNTPSYRFGLSILAGVYAFLLIVLGISRKKKYLRIAALALFGATLAKLFFYDITRLDIILKTILFMSLGILMLVISFLYNKYKKQLYGEAAEPS